MTYDTAANLTVNGYTKTGYTFTGWNTQTDGKGTAYTDGQNVINLTAAEGETVTLYAQWRANTYTIKFDGNTADSGSTQDQAMTYDQAADLTINSYTKTGYTFTGWSTQQDGKGTIYADGQNVINLTPEEGGMVTLYAQWRANSYTIRFDGNRNNLYRWTKCHQSDACRRWNSYPVRSVACQHLHHQVRWQHRRRRQHAGSGHDL